MWLAGFDFSDLAREVDLPKLRESTLRRLTARTTTRLQLEPIATACGLPYEFFTVDFSRLPDLEKPAESEPVPTPATADDLAQLRERVDQLAGQVAAVVAATLPPSEEEPPATGDPQGPPQR